MMMSIQVTARGSQHLGIAEAGKLLALAGSHSKALFHYREAIRLAIADRAPDVFFRHYTQCVLESLERTGSYPEVIEYCFRADEYYLTFDHLNPFQRRDHGATLERLGAVLVKSDRHPEALPVLQRAVDTAGAGVLPLAETLISWLRRGLRPDVRRITELQDRHRYFTVRPDLVDAALAIELPASLQKATPLVPAPSTGRP